MAQSLEELSTMYLEPGESDLVSTGGYNVALGTDDAHQTLTLTTLSGVSEEQLKIPKSSKGQVSLHLNLI